MLTCVGPKRNIQDLVDELLEEIAEKDISDRLSAATVLRKQVMSLSIILEAWRMWVTDIVFLDLLPSEDLEKMIKDFTKVLVTVAPPSRHFSNIVEEFSEGNTCDRQREDSSGEIRVV